MWRSDIGHQVWRRALSPAERSHQAQKVLSLKASDLVAPAPSLWVFLCYASPVLGGDSEVTKLWVSTRLSLWLSVEGSV